MCEGGELFCRIGSFFSLKFVGKNCKLSNMAFETILVGWVMVAEGLYTRHGSWLLGRVRSEGARDRYAPYMGAGWWGRQV